MTNSNEYLIIDQLILNKNIFLDAKLLIAKLII